MADFILVYKALTNRNYFKIFIQVLYFFCQNMLPLSLANCLAKARDIEYNVMGCEDTNSWKLKIGIRIWQLLGHIMSKLFDRARRGGSGALYLQSATAGWNSRSRLDSVGSAPYKWQ